jgi:hypothetical protein
MRSRVNPTRIGGDIMGTIIGLSCLFLGLLALRSIASDKKRELYGQRDNAVEIFDSASSAVIHTSPLIKAGYLIPSVEIEGLSPETSAEPPEVKETEILQFSSPVSQQIRQELPSEIRNAIEDGTLSERACKLSFQKGRSAGIGIGRAQAQNEIMALRKELEKAKDQNRRLIAKAAFNTWQFGVFDHSVWEENEV